MLTIKTTKIKLREKRNKAKEMNRDKNYLTYYKRKISFVEDWLLGPSKQLAIPAELDEQYPRRKQSQDRRKAYIFFLHCWDQLNRMNLLYLFQYNTASVDSQTLNSLGVLLCF